MELTSKQATKYIRKAYEQETGPVSARYGSVSLREHALWNLAIEAPFGARVISTNEDSLEDPYLLRVYLTPERGEAAAALRRIGVPPKIARLSKAARPFLHYFFRGDDDRAYHNHPMAWSASFILTTGYLDHRWDFAHKCVRTKTVRPGQVNIIRRDDFHRVELHAGGCWTLFLSGKRVDELPGFEWGFYDPTDDSYTPWSIWEQRRGIGGNPKIQPSFGGEPGEG